MIGSGVHIYIYLWTKKIFESYFSDRLTFSNIRSRTCRQMYRLALLLCAPEMLSSLSKSRISIFNAHLTLFVRRMTSHNSIGKYRHFSKLTWNGVSPLFSELELALEVKSTTIVSPLADQTTSRIVAELGKNARSNALEAV